MACSVRDLSLVNHRYSASSNRCRVEVMVGANFETPVAAAFDVVAR